MTCGSTNAGLLRTYSVEMMRTIDNLPCIQTIAGMGEDCRWPIPIKYQQLSYWLDETNRMNLLQNESSSRREATNETLTHIVDQETSKYGVSCLHIIATTSLRRNCSKDCTCMETRMTTSVHHQPSKWQYPPLNRSYPLVKRSLQRILKDYERRTLVWEKGVMKTELVVISTEPIIIFVVILYRWYNKEN